jgi:phage/plasmid-like protein (TIGR03299 family)
VDNTFHVQRSSDGKVIGTVKSRYNPLQNVEAFQFGDDLLDASGAHWITAGSLKGGSLVWMMAQLPEAVYIAGMEDEAIQPYLMVSNGHDGLKAVEATVTPVRVVCNNTFTAALGQAKRTFKIRHTKNMSGRITEAKRALDITHAYMAELEALGTKLVNEKFSNDEFDKFLESLVPTVELERAMVASEKDKSIALTKALNKQESIKSIYINKPDLQNVKGTKWGALQAVIDYNDHHIDGRGDNKAEKRMSRILMPNAANIGHTALDLLLA